MHFNVMATASKRGIGDSGLFPILKCKDCDNCYGVNLLHVIMSLNFLRPEDPLPFSILSNNEDESQLQELILSRSLFVSL